MERIMTTGKRPRRFRTKARGFTLFEVLIVLTLLGLIAGLAYPSVTKAIQRSREASLKTTLMSTRTALDDYYADKGHYPDAFSTLVDERYLRRAPFDPITQSTDWTLERDDGIVDLHSQSGERSLNGTYYREW